MQQEKIIKFTYRKSLLQPDSPHSQPAQLV